MASPDSLPSKNICITCRGRPVRSQRFQIEPLHQWPVRTGATGVTRWPGRPPLPRSRGSRLCAVTTTMRSEEQFDFRVSTSTSMVSAPQAAIVVWRRRAWDGVRVCYARENKSGRMKNGSEAAGDSTPAVRTPTQAAVVDRRHPIPLEAVPCGVRTPRRG